MYWMINEKFFLGKTSIDVEKQRILIKTDLGRNLKINRTGHKISTIDLIEWKFAFVSVVNHCFELIEIS